MGSDVQFFSSGTRSNARKDKYLNLFEKKNGMFIDAGAQKLRPILHKDNMNLFM